jgi:type IV secretory pathway VirB10-like protein
MRSDYGLYVVAVICFIITGIFLTGTVEGYKYTDSMGMAAIAIFLILGAIFALAGYAVRPKVPVSAISTAPLTLPEPSAPPLLPPAEEKEEETPATQPLPQEEQAPQAPQEPTPTVEETPPTPAPTVEEPAKAEEEKPVRRRRKKKTA